MLVCLLCKKTVKTDVKESVEKEAKKVGYSLVEITKPNKEKTSFFVCSVCSNALWDLENRAIIREKKKLPHVYIPKSFKKFAVIRLE